MLKVQNNGNSEYFHYDLISTFRLIYSHHQDKPDYPDDDCILVETLILNHDKIIWSFHYFVLHQIT